MTRAITIIAMTCLLVAGTAATSILGRDSVPSGGVASPVVNSPVVANREGKADKLTVMRLALASVEPPPTTGSLSETLRQAYAASSAADVEAAKLVMAPATPAAPQVPAKPKAASKPDPAKILRAAQRRPDRRHQGPAQAFCVTGALLAGG